jgi:hypothetical protein
MKYKKPLGFYIPAFHPKALNDVNMNRAGLLALSKRLKNLPAPQAKQW